MDWSTLNGILFWKNCVLFTLTTAFGHSLANIKKTKKPQKTLVVICKTSTKALELLGSILRILNIMRKRTTTENQTIHQAITEISDLASSCLVIRNRRCVVEAVEEEEEGASSWFMSLA